MGDFNIDLLKTETSNFSHDFLLSLQSYYLMPTIDKPTRVHNSSATLIDNIFVTNPQQCVSSGNIISDLSDHFSQFCISNFAIESEKPIRSKIRDHSKFSSDEFNDELSQVDWDMMITNSKHDINKLFSFFYNKVNNLVNKHASLHLKLFPVGEQNCWGNHGLQKGSLRKSIRIKNRLMLSGNEYKYKYYSNEILNLTRISKQLYYQKFFENNLRNIRKTWEGINNLIYRKSRPKQKRIHKIEIKLSFFVRTKRSTHFNLK